MTQKRHPRFVGGGGVGSATVSSVGFVSCGTVPIDVDDAFADAGRDMMGARSKSRAAPGAICHDSKRTAPAQSIFGTISLPLLEMEGGFERDSPHRSHAPGTRGRRRLLINLEAVVIARA